jgi:hypothetical protein
MGGNSTAARLTARATRLDAYAARLADELDAYVRREAKRLRDDYERAGVSVGRQDAPDDDELAYTVEIITIQPGEGGDGVRSVTLDLSAKITETETYRAYIDRRRTALDDAEWFRSAAGVGADPEEPSHPVAAADADPTEARQTTIGEYLR